MTPARWVAVVVLILAAVFAWTGGTFSERSYLELKRIEIADSVRVTQLQHEVDSLRAFRDSLESNPAVQERVAREEFGMQRPGELTYVIVRDSVPPKRSP